MNFFKLIIPAISLILQIFYLAPEVVPYIVGGEKVNITKVPWHIGIFTDITSKNTFSQICGGTIINAKLVISAAHCFWDTVENRLYEASNFKVGAGKYYRDFYATEPTKPQIVDVAQIITKQEYNDYAGYFALDIALLILVEHFEFKSYIKPICLETNLNFNEKYVQPGAIGKVNCEFPSLNNVLKELRFCYRWLDGA